MTSLSPTLTLIFMGLSPRRSLKKLKKPLIFCIFTLEDYQPNQLEAKNLYNRYYIEIYELKGLSLGWAYFMRP